MRSETAQLRPEEFPCYEKGNHIRYYIFVDGHPVTVSLAEQRDQTLSRRVKSILLPAEQSKEE